ncbi:FG-GAP-like repeat-containing protein [Tautonia rosea]|uniref:FG-GAP-like repeat-containing protein n=1 Tax=Tautonia rosea TaxID=2728037 RepID=UPI0014731809|nr:FG-GAP-like repeat-containing protein [Tautonia rosea]
MRGHWWITGPALLLVVGGLSWFGVRAWGPDLLDGRFRGNRPLGSPTRPEAEPSWDAILKASQDQQWPQVERLLRDWIDRRDDDGRARLMLAQLLVSSNREGEAARTLAAVPQADPAFAEARSFLGEMALAASDTARAELAFRQAAESDPKAVSPRGRLIYLLSLQLRTAEARETLWEIFEATGEPGVLIDLVLEATKAEIDVRGIGPEIEQFLRQSPNDPFLRRAHGLALLWKGELTEALPHLEAAAEALVDDPLGRFSLAECRTQLGLPVTLPDDLGPIPESPADAARWWLFLGRLQEADAPEAAADHYREALAANPLSAEAHHRLSQVLARLGEDPEAADLAQRAEEIRDRWADLRRQFDRRRINGLRDSAEEMEQLGDLCRQAGLIAEARAWYDEALRREPDRASTRSSIAQLAELSDAPPIPLSRPRPIALAASGSASVSPPASTDRPSTAELPASSEDIRPRFVDIAASSGISYQYDYGPKPDIYLADTMGGGVALIDFDRDGWLDIYFVNSCVAPYDPDTPPRPNRLYRNNGDGTFSDVTEAAGVGGIGYGMGATVADFDNNGFDDLFLTGLDRTLLYRNNGDGTFSDVTEAAGVFSNRWTTAAGFADLDGDGDLDLMVVAYVEHDPAKIDSCRDANGRLLHCSPGLYPPYADLLFRNNGDGTFSDVSEAAGIASHRGPGLGLAIADLDGDDRLDLYVANDAAPDHLFRNLGNLQFEEMGVASGLAFDGSGHATASMGVVADDLDGDGLIDIFHTNFLNEANTLHRNLGGGQFLDVTMSAGLAAPSLATTGFGAVPLDVANNGRLDLFLANGHVDDQPWVNAPMAQPPQLFLSVQPGRFALASSEQFPYLDRRVVGRGLAAGDLNNDGRVDLVVVHRDTPAAILLNQTEGGHRVGLRLIGSEASGRTPVGARVLLEANGLRQVRWMTTGTSYLSSSDSRLWFGLGSAASIDRLDIHWPSGAQQTLTELPADQIYEIREAEDPRSQPLLPKGFQTMNVETSPP